MKQYVGKTIFPKVAIGKILFYEKKQATVKREKVEDVKKEVKRFENAKKIATEEITDLYQKAIKNIGAAEAAIFEVHAMMIEDDDYCDSIINIITAQEMDAAYAVATTGDNFARMFGDMEDEYMKARAADVKDISERIVNVLSGTNTGSLIMEEQVILVADDLVPSETVQMDKSKLLGFITQYGSVNSHTAILARMMNIPALIEVKIDKAWDGQLAILDGYKASCIL